MVNKRVLASRLERLHEYLDMLEKIRNYDCAHFIEDPFIHSTAERNLHLAIECLLDIGNHIIADRGFTKPESYADILRILCKNQIISEELNANLEGIAAFRNILVHDYLRLDRERIFQMIQNRTRYLEELGSVFASLL